MLSPRTWSRSWPSVAVAMGSPWSGPKAILLQRDRDWNRSTRVGPFGQLSLRNVAPRRCHVAYARAVAGPASAHVDVEHFDRVIAVAQPVPGRRVGLDVAGGVRCPGAERVPARRGPVPLERPVLPVVGAGRRLEVGGQPLARAGQREV